MEEIHAERMIVAALAVNGMELVFVTSSAIFIPSCRSSEPSGLDAMTAGATVDAH